MELKFRAWSEIDGGVMFEPGDDYGTTHVLDCVRYFRDGQNMLLMQFIGLTDNTGKDYYIGDIGEFENGDKFCLEMESWLEVYGWMGNPQCEDQARDLYRISNAKIIGNCHQHPKLMDRGNNND